MTTAKDALEAIHGGCNILAQCVYESCTQHVQHALYQQIIEIVDGNGRYWTTKRKAQYQKLLKERGSEPIPDYLLEYNDEYNEGLAELKSKLATFFGQDSKGQENK